MKPITLQVLKSRTARETVERRSRRVTGSADQATCFAAQSTTAHPTKMIVLMIMSQLRQEFDI